MIKKLKGLIRRLTTLKTSLYTGKSDKEPFDIIVIAANEIFKKGYAYGYYVFRIRVYTNTFSDNVLDLLDALGATDIKYICDKKDEYIDIYMSGTNEYFGEFIFGLWYETIHPLVLFDRSIIEYIEKMKAIYWFRNDNTDGWIISPISDDIDISIKSNLTETTLIKDIQEISKEAEKNMLGYIFNINDHYEFFSYNQLALIYTIEKNYINGRYQWIIDILEEHPEEIKKISEYNTIVSDGESGFDNFDPDIDEII